MPSRYNRGSTLTRQLTSDEEELDRRTSALIQSKPQEPVAFTGGGRYGWMEKDLKMRALQAGVIQAENQIATDMGDKRKLAEADTRITEEEDAAKRGLSSVEDLVNGGMDYNEAIRKVSIDQGLGFNEGFAKAAAERAKLYESPADKAFRESKKRVEGLQLERQEFDLEAQNEALRGDGAKAKAVKAYRDRLEAEGITAENSVVAANADKIVKRQSLDEAERISRDLNGLDPASDENEAAMTHAFNQIGLGGVTSVAGVVKMFGSSPKIMQALVNQDYLEREFGKKDENGRPVLDASGKRVMDEASFGGFTRALNILTDPTEETTPNEIKQARSVVLGYAGKYNSDMSEMMADKAFADSRRQVVSSVFKNNDEVGKRIKSIVEMKDEYKNPIPDNKRKELIRDAVINDFKQAKAGAGLDPDINLAEENAIHELMSNKNISAEEMAEKARAEVSKFSGRMMRKGVMEKEQADVRSASTPLNRPTAAEIQSKPSAQPSPAKRLTREMAIQKANELGSPEAALKWFRDNGYNVNQ